MKSQDIKKDYGLDFKELVKKDFNGDFDKALEYILENKDALTIDRYISPLRGDDYHKLVKGYIKYMDRNYPGGFDTIVLERKVAAKLKTNADILRAMKINPYKAHVKTALLAAALCFAGLFVIGVIFSRTSISKSIFSILMMGITMLTCKFTADFGLYFARYMSFRKLQKIYSTPEYKKQYEKYLGNKKHLDSLTLFYRNPFDNI